MPKRLEGQKRRGRPPSAKKKTRDDDATGALFPAGYGIWRVINDNDSPLEQFAKVREFFESVRLPAKAWSKDSAENFESEVLPRLLEELESLQANSLNSLPYASGLSESEILEADILSMTLLSEVNSALKFGEMESVRLIAAAFTLGQISIVHPRRSKERDFAIGEKFSKHVQAGAAVRKIKRPTKRKIEQALQSEFKKHSKRTLAITNTAILFGVSKNTLRTWIKELGITF